VIVRVVRLVLGGLLLAWLADWWLGERSLRKSNRGDGRVVLAGPIRSSVVIQAPVERVWKEITDIPGQPRWMTDLRSVRVVTPGPIRVGSRLDGTVSMYGISVPDPVEISVWEPPLLYGVRHVGMWKGEGLIRLTLDGEATQVEWTERLVAPVLPHLADVIQRFVFGPIFQADLENLKTLVEGAPAEGAPADGTAPHNAPAAGERPEGAQPGGTEPEMAPQADAAAAD
jgi:hypothetical protein